MPLFLCFLRHFPYKRSGKNHAFVTKRQKFPFGVTMGEAPYGVNQRIPIIA